jgi:hypothetical protein
MQAEAAFISYMGIGKQCNIRDVVSIPDDIRMTHKLLLHRLERLMAAGEVKENGIRFGQTAAVGQRRQWNFTVGIRSGPRKSDSAIRWNPA